MANSEVLVLPDLLEVTSKREPETDRSYDVLFAIHTARDPHTAVYNNTRERATWLQSLGHRCTIITPEDFPWLRRFGAKLIPLLFPIALARYLAQRRFDIASFHSHAGWATFLLRPLIRQFRRLRAMIMFHGLEPLYFHRMHEETPLSLRYRLMHGGMMHWLLRLSCRRADRILCLNSEEQRYLVQNRWASSDRISVLSNSAPENFFIARHHRDRATKLLFVGQWLPMKGTHYLVEAFTRLNRAHRDLSLCLAGTLTEESDVLRAFPYDVRPHVSVHTRVNRTQLLELHRTADIFVFPTLSEGFSLALAEAMASGLPIVTTRVGAAPDLLHHQQSAFFVPVRDSEALIVALEQLVADRVLRERLAYFSQLSAQRLRPEYSSREFGRCFQELAADASTRQATLDTPGFSGTTSACR